MPKIKCLLVDDHTLFRQGVRRLLESESDFEVIGEAADGGEAVEKARELRPDIVLMDIDMPGTNGIEGVRLIKESNPQTNIIMFTVFEDTAKIFSALAAGAPGYLLKRSPPAIVCLRR